MIEKPNLVLGNGTSKLGSYEYGVDTINISRILLNGKRELLDYVMYHEMLHKKHKFYTKSGRSYHHTSAFKKAEKKFENAEEIEEKLARLCRKKKIKRSFFFNLLK